MIHVTHTPCCFPDLPQATWTPLCSSFGNYRGHMLQLIGTVIKNTCLITMSSSHSPSVIQCMLSAGLNFLTMNITLQVHFVICLLHCVYVKYPVSLSWYMLCFAVCCVFKFICCPCLFMLNIFICIMCFRVHVVYSDCCCCSCCYCCMLNTACLGEGSLGKSTTISM